MKPRTLALAAASLLAAVVLLTLLAMHAAIGWDQVVATLKRTRLERVALLGALAAFLAYLSAERWRMIERHTAGHTAPSLLRAFGLTALGAGIGQFVPVQLATVISRAVGSRLLKPAASPRPVVVTLYEQSFDVGVAVLLAVASAGFLATHARWPWLAFAVPMLVVGYAVVGPIAGRFAWLFGLFVGKGRAGAWMADLAGSDIFSGALARRLMLVSVVRFAVTALMAGLTSWSAALPVPLEDAAAALPLVVIATAVPLTPAGLGVNEWTYAGILTALGIAGPLAAEWALVNRILVFAVSIVIGLAAIPLLALSRRAPSAGPPMS